MSISFVKRDEFIAAISNDKADRFAKTFVAKADMIDGWNDAWGYYIDGQLAGAVILTISKRKPKVANLQLLHTFAKYRKQGVGEALMRWANILAMPNASYFRVSSEPEAVGFYERIGYHFWGSQKSGCKLCMFRYDIDDDKFSRSYDPHDPVINGAIYRKGKGGVVELDTSFYEAQKRNFAPLDLTEI